MRPFKVSSLVRRHTWSVFLLILSIGPNARADSATIHTCCSSREVAFARYIASQEQRDPFAQSGGVGIIIEASLPEFYKSAALLAVRKQGDKEHSDLDILRIAGDGTVAAEVIDRYFALRQQIDALPLSSVAVTPANYKFHFAGEMKTGGAAAYIYDIAPKKNRPGLMVGQLWMDAATGRELMLAGHLLDVPAKGSRANVVRDTTLMNGSAYARVTHVGLAIPRLGRAELVITEFVLNTDLIPKLE